MVGMSSWQDPSGQCVVNELSGEVDVRIEYPSFLEVSK